MTKKIDQVANLWNKTKDPKYKDLWYKLIEEMHGLNNPERRTISTDSCNKENVEGIVLTEKIDCFDLCDILRLKLTGYVDTLNLHIMKDGSVMVGCMCR